MEELQYIILFCIVIWGCWVLFYITLFIISLFKLDKLIVHNTMSTDKEVKLIV